MQNDFLSTKRPHRSPRDLANDAAAKARGYRRKALLAEQPDLNRLVLSLRHALAFTEKRATFEKVHEELLMAQIELAIVLDSLVGA